MQASPFQKLEEIQSTAKTVVTAMTVVSEMVKKNHADICLRIQKHQQFIDLVNLANKSPHPKTARPFPRPGHYAYIIDDCGQFIHINGDAGSPSGNFVNAWQSLCVEIYVDEQGLVTTLKHAINFEALEASCVETSTTSTDIDTLFP